MAKTDNFCNRAEAYEAHDNVPLSPAGRDAIGDIIFRRYSRRAGLRGTLGTAAPPSEQTRRPIAIGDMMGLVAAGFDLREAEAILDVLGAGSTAHE